MDEIKITDDSIKYILLQRTDSLRNIPVGKVFRHIGRTLSLYKLTLRILSILSRNQIKKAFSNDMLGEYYTIRNFLPPSASSILDIGCGVAGIDIFLSKHYKNRPDIFLIDKTFVGKKIYYGFQGQGAFYNSLVTAKRLLTNNDINPDNIHLQEATTKNEILFKENFDLVISLLSWGFHYPVSTYLDQVHDRLKVNGVLILDVRKKTEGEKNIEKKFGNSRAIFESPSFLRITAQKM